MRASRSFAKLLGTALYRLARLRERAVIALGSAPPQRDKGLSSVVIETLNLWSNFSRQYVLSCLFRPTRALKMGRVQLSNAAIQTPGDLIHAAARIRFGPTAPAPATRRQEPKWHEKDLLFKTCQAIGCSHLADVQAALSLGTRVFDDMPACRNFYAHRNDETAATVIALGKKQYLITGAEHPTDVLAFPAYKRPQPLILDWLDDMRIVMELLCE